MNKILLVQTDTTVGFLSQDAQRLERVKMRLGNKPFLKVYADLKNLSRDIRVPAIHKHRIRHSRKTTFVVKDQAFRYVQDKNHAPFIKPYGWFYSTSANESGKHYNREFCAAAADWIVEDYRGLYEAEASSIYRLGLTSLQKLR